MSNDATNETEAPAEEGKKGSKVILIAFVCIIMLVETTLFFLLVPSADEVARLAEARLVQNVQQLALLRAVQGLADLAKLGVGGLAERLGVLLGESIHALGRGLHVGFGDLVQGGDLLLRGLRQGVVFLLLGHDLLGVGALLLDHALQFLPLRPLLILQLLDLVLPPRCQRAGLCVRGPCGRRDWVTTIPRARTSGGC